MTTPKSDAEIALDAIIADTGVTLEGDTPTTPDLDDETTTPDLDDETTTPPGFMNYEEWVAAGKDPADFKGENAYRAEFDRIQDNKHLKTEVKDLKTMVSQIVEYQDEVVARARQEGRQELEAELAEARENSDVDAALDAQNKLNALDAEAPTEASPPKKHEAVVRMMQAHPILDPDSDAYNEDYATDFAGLYNGWIGKLQASGQPLTDKQIEKVWKASVKEAEALNPDVVRSKKRGRQSQGGAGGGGGTPSGGTTLANMTIESRNPANRNAPSDVAKALKEKFGDAFDESKFAQSLSD